MRNFRRTYCILAVLPLTVLFEADLRAQYTTGSLGGTVMDASGASVPQARVSARTTTTGFEQTVLTENDGTFLFPRLPVGTYQLMVEKAGFQTYVQDGITIQVNQAASQRVTLQVGQPTQQVTVSGNADLVATRTDTVGQVVAQRQIVDLPLDGREAQSLVFLAAGTVDVTGNYCGFGCHGGVYPGEQQASVNGAGPGQVNYQLDGAGHNDTYLNMNLPFPNPDSVEEFSLQSDNLSAEFGNAASGVVNIVTKSGTNEFHGDAFEFLRNGALNARNYFAPTQDTLKRNQFGGSVGGPIKKDKLFFFGTYQGTRIQSTSQAQVQFVPTAAERTGDFSDLLPTQLVDPVTGASFANNQIPAGRLSAPALFFLQHIPLPNGPNHQLTFAGPNVVQDENQFMGKADYTRGKHQVSARYFFTNFKEPPFIAKANILAADPNGNRVRVQNVAINETYNVSPQLLFNTWFGWDLQTGGSLSSAPYGFPDAGVKIAAPTPPELSVYVAGYFNFNTNHNGNFDRGDWTARENVTLMKGAHEIQFGGEYLRVKKHLVNTFTMSGEFSFFNDLSGNNLADFMLGRADDFLQGGGEFSRLHGSKPSAYVQDNWRVNPKLTVNLGLRWDPFIPYIDEGGRITCFQPGAHSMRYPNAPLGLLYGGSNHDAGCPPGGANNRFSDFGPRLGFAYRLTDDGKTSVRGGIGYYYTALDSHLYNVMVDVPPFSPRFEFTDVDFTDPFASAGVVNPFPAQYGPRLPGPDATFTLPAALYGVFQKDFQLPQLATWNLTVERQFGKDWVLRTAYVGSRGIHLDGDYKATLQANPAVYIPGQSTEANTQQRRLYPNFSTVGEITSVNNSNHNALQVNLERHFSHGLYALANYTWSKTLDDINWDDPFNRRYDYGPSNDDISHVFKFSSVWQIPHPGAQGIAGKLVSGWELNSILLWQGGFPFTVYSGSDNSFSGVGSDHADFMGTNFRAAQLSSGRPHGQLINEWFNTSLFAANAIGTFGNSGKNNLRGPKLFNTNLGLLKDTKITERTSVQFRAEFFNVFNNVNFGGPDNTVSDSTFGQIFSAGGPRIIQFALKILF